MKHFNPKSILTIIFIVISGIASAQKTIYMEKESGVYKVPCTINGIMTKFIFDTGSANVCITRPMFEYLYEYEYIDDGDLLEYTTSILADGSEVMNRRVNIRDIEIGGYHLYNVKAVVMNGQQASMLLGLSAIQKLGKVTLEGNKLTINGQTSYDSSTSLSSVRSTSNNSDSYNVKVEYNGEGPTYCYPSGDKYVGHWKNGKYEGLGTYYYNNGDVYKGQWHNGLMHGHGSYTWANGQKYVGDYKYDKKNGYGTFYYKNGTKKYGYWRNGKFVK